MNDYLNRVARPSSVGNGSVPTQQTNNSKKNKFRFDTSKIIMSALFVSVAILLIALVVYLLIFKNGNTSTMDQVKPSQYQAVFLNSSDGQVYFGRLRNLNEQYYALQDIYYVRVNQVQPDKNATATTQTNISLAKLGNEIHGPEDTMYINKDDVMFWENLKEEGQVVCAIRDYQITKLNMTGVKKSDKCGAGNATATPTPTPAN